MREWYSIVLTNVIYCTFVLFSFQPRKQNIPVGDPDKEFTKLSVTRSSFDNHNVLLKPHTSEVGGQLRKTNYKERDGHGAWDKYETTMISAFPAKSVDCKLLN